MNKLSTFWEFAVDIASDIGTKFVGFFEDFVTKTVLQWGTEIDLFPIELFPEWLKEWLDVPFISVLIGFGLTIYPLYQLVKWTLGIITGS
jgi:hypothetical protein